MIELTPEQAQAQTEQKAPLHVLNPTTQEVYVLIKKDVYEGVSGILRPLNRAWDNPEDDDLIRRDR